MSHRHPKIRPIVIYPFVQPRNIASLELLYSSLAKLAGDDRFQKPVTVINNQTRFRSIKPWVDNDLLDIAFKRATTDVISPVSEVVATWSVDTCALWLRGLGDAFEEAEEERAHHDVFWLIPGDFDFSTPQGKEALDRLPLIPVRVYEAECEVCLGEIQVPINSAKQLIDTYGTYGLLYNRFLAGRRDCAKSLINLVRNSSRSTIRPCARP